MKKWKKKFSSINLQWFDINANFKDNVFFVKIFFKNSRNGFLLSIILMIILLIADFLIRKLVFFLDSFSNNSFPCRLAEFAFLINYKIGLKYINYLAEVISITAGVLGLILGLFYTAFITIVATKYSNINSVIRFQLLEQKSINNYFVLLASLTSLAILFQLFLSLGYNPTIISCSLFTIVIIATISSFIRYGKFSLIFFDTSYLVNDLININKRILDKIIHNKSHIGTLGKGKFYINQIYHNIDKIQVIIRESQKTKSTSLDIISGRLLDFSIFYNSIKHKIPSINGWHLQTTKFKSWDEAREWDFRLLNSTGVNIQPELVDNYYLIERKIIDTQFELFHQYINESEEVIVLYDQNKFLQVTSTQCDFENIGYFFDKLQKFIVEKLQTVSSENQILRLQLISIYPQLLIAHLVGFNFNLSGFDNKRLKKLAKAIHLGKNTDNILQFPYFIRKWFDLYREKLNTEKFLIDKNVTTLFYTEFELSNNIQYEFQKYWYNLALYCHNSILQFSKLLNERKCELEALHLNMESIELCKKITFFSESLNNLINDLNDLNFQSHDTPFKFENLEELLNKNNVFNEQLLTNIWDVGFSAYKVKIEKLPDIYGSFYQLIINDIIEKLLTYPPNIELIIKYLPKYLINCSLYIESLKEKYKDSNNIELYASKLLPLIIDMYDVCSIAILIGKIHDQEGIIESIFNYWARIYENPVDEEKYWKLINSVYAYSKQTLGNFRTSSYFREYDRKHSLEKYLLEYSIVRKEFSNDGLRISFVEQYLTDIKDLYVQGVVSSMYRDSIEFIELDEIFVEYFLRTRISLKELVIKETHYGEDLEELWKKRIFNQKFPLIGSNRPGEGNGFHDRLSFHVPNHLLKKKIESHNSNWLYSVYFRDLSNYLNPQYKGDRGEKYRKAIRLDNCSENYNKTFIKYLKNTDGWGEDGVLEILGYWGDYLIKHGRLIIEFVSWYDNFTQDFYAYELKLINLSFCTFKKNYILFSAPKKGLQEEINEVKVKIPKNKCIIMEWPNEIGGYNSYQKKVNKILEIDDPYGTDSDKAKYNPSISLKRMKNWELNFNKLTSSWGTFHPQNLTTEFYKQLNYFTLKGTIIYCNNVLINGLKELINLLNKKLSENTKLNFDFEEIEIKKFQEIKDKWLNGKLSFKESGEFLKF